MTLYRVETKELIYRTYIVEAASADDAEIAVQDRINNTEENIHDPYVRGREYKLVRTWNGLEVVDSDDTEEADEEEYGHVI